jgi:hypothetical protein
MYQHKNGYGPGEQFAAHARRRYRLLPSKFPNPAAPSPDGAFWITHYFSSEPADRVPSSMIPITDMRAQQTRMYLQTQGQIVQKEFMLHDRTNWPQIQFPRGPPRSGQYSGVMAQTRTPQSMAYPPHSAGTTLGPPPKRARTQANQNQGPPVIGAPPPAEMIDDEEDTSRGDLFDQTTPREVSISRFKQNHEWMEEILSSPYSISQIEPVDLGFGLRGELSNLTDGIFYAPTGIEHVHNGHVSKLDPAKTDDFRKRVSEHVADTIAEMEKIKARHAKRMAKIRKGALVTEAEKALRTAIHSPGDIGSEYWRLEGRIENNEDGESLVIASKIQGSVNGIVAKVEASLGRHAVAVQELRRIQDGGLEESPALPSTPPSRHGSQTGSQQSGVLIGDADIDMGGSVADALEQFHTGFSSMSTPGNSFPTPQAHLQTHSSVGTPANVPSPQPAASGAAAPATSSGGRTESMDTGATSKDGQGNSDWVVVPPGGVSPQSDSVGRTILDAGATAPRSAPSTSSHQTPQAETMDDDQNLDMDLGDNFATDVNDFGSLEDLDTAGEALASFGDGDDHGGSMSGDLDLGLDMGMDDSAFGDAFHGVEPRDGEGEGDGI